MTNEFTEIFISAIEKAEPGLVHDVSVEDFSVEEDYLYCKLTYQIDDRIDRDTDEQVSLFIEKELGDEYGVIVNRVDSFPNGYAAYNVIIDK